MGDAAFGEFAQVAVVTAAVEVGAEEDGVGTDFGGDFLDFSTEAVADKRVVDMARLRNDLRAVGNQQNGEACFTCCAVGRAGGRCEDEKVVFATEKRRMAVRGEGADRVDAPFQHKQPVALRICAGYVTGFMARGGGGEHEGAIVAYEQRCLPSGARNIDLRAGADRVSADEKSECGEKCQQ